MGKTPLILTISIAVVSFLAIIAGLIGGSFHKVEQNEACLEYDIYSRKIEPKPFTSPGSYYLGLGKGFKCFPSTVFSVTVADSATLETRTNDGIEINLDISFQYQLLTEEIYQIFSDVNLEYEQYYILLARSRLRNLASGYHSSNFLSSERANISRELKVGLDEHFSTVHARVVDLQIDEVHFPDQLAYVIRQIDETTLDILTAQQQQQIAIQNEISTNATAYQQAVNDGEESLITANNLLSTTIQNRAVLLTSENASAVQQLQLAADVRQTVLLNAQSKVTQALTNRQVVIATAEALKAQRIIEFQTKVNQAQADATVISINANATAQEILTKGAADASGLAAQYSTERDSMITLVTAGMTAPQILKYKYLLSLAQHDNANFFIDYQKVGLLLETGKDVPSGGYPIPN